MNAISNFFKTGYMPKAFNETLVTLIPKIDTLLNLSQFKPISFSNAVYKIISKILVNRVKPLLKVCSSQSQAVDNLIIGHECIHWLNHTRKGRDACMVLKIVISKAHDRVKWRFLFEVMARMGFCHFWTKWICGYLESMSFPSMLIVTN